jgi:hypothetical protein
MYFLYLALWWRTFNFQFFPCTERELEIRIKFSFLKKTSLSFSSFSSSSRSADEEYNGHLVLSYSQMILSHRKLKQNENNYKVDRTGGASSVKNCN